MSEPAVRGKYQLPLPFYIYRDESDGQSLSRVVYEQLKWVFTYILSDARLFWPYYELKL